MLSVASSIAHVWFWKFLKTSVSPPEKIISMYLSLKSVSYRIVKNEPLRLILRPLKEISFFHKTTLTSTLSMYDFGENLHSMHISSCIACIARGEIR